MMITSVPIWSRVTPVSIRVSPLATLEALAEKMRQLGLPGENKKVFICHGDSLEDAKYLEKVLKEKCGVEEAFIGYTGAVIGSHSGPGTIALFFLGSNR
jgi:fatty acid-binding protein DegV